MLSAICFNVEQSNILSSGKGLISFQIITLRSSREDRFRKLV